MSFPLTFLLVSLSFAFSFSLAFAFAFDHADVHWSSSVVYCLGSQWANSRSSCLQVVDNQVSHGSVVGQLWVQSEVLVE